MREPCSPLPKENETAARRQRVFPGNCFKCRLIWACLLAAALTVLSHGAAAPTPNRSREAKPATVPKELAELVPAMSNQECLDCHGLPDLAKTNQAGQVISLYMDVEKLKLSVHGTNSCSQCHSDLKATHPDDEVAALPVNCGACHSSQSQEYATSIHGVSQTMSASAAATCADCHGSHDMGPVTKPDSPVFKFNLPKTCAKCHGNPGLTEEYRIGNPEAADQYTESIHGQGLMRMGLIVAPSCNDCHGVHDIKRSIDRSSPIHHSNIGKTCGNCHVGIQEVFDRSVHGKALANGNGGKQVATCTDCHTAHEIENPGRAHFKAGSDQRCGKCHQDRLENYHETYHGKAMVLGKPNVAPDVAACHDCHGHHDILPQSDPKSRLSAANIVETCQKCHPSANAGFAQYIPHADPTDRENYPQLNAVFIFMTALLLGVFAFFGGHTLLWLVRSIYLYRHDSKTFREAKAQSQREDDEWYTRFQPFDRFLHFLVVTSFLLLVLTGMPLKFYYTSWAKAIFAIMGGAEVARSLHHFGAIVTFLYFALHLGHLVSMAWRRRGVMRDPATGRIQLKRLWKCVFGPDSMVPTMQDWRDFVAHQKWFFGKGPKPQFDRWTYWEKFDYFAVFWGVFIIGSSGMILWFPEIFSLVLPGWFINIAIIVHSDEALLAAGFIFTIHFFNTHFRIEKFPMDTVIFSGRISKTEMIHERRRWYDRLLAEGRLSDHRVKDEWANWKRIARSFGYIFFGAGLVLLALIVYAMTRHLTHNLTPEGRRPEVHNVSSTVPAGKQEPSKSQQGVRRGEP